MKILTNSWKFLKFLENSWKFLKIPENSWKSLKIVENCWKFMKFFEILEHVYHTEKLSKCLPGGHPVHGEAVQMFTWWSSCPWRSCPNVYLVVILSMEKLFKCLPGGCPVHGDVDQIPGGHPVHREVVPVAAAATK